MTQTKKIFLASSSELVEDRKEFELLISRKNVHWIRRGVFLELVVWENFIDALSRTRLQDEYNKAVRGCDIFVMLFFTKVGQYTREEFEAAFGQFRTQRKPVIYTYFKDAAITTGRANQQDLNSLWAFQHRLRELEHFWTVYQNTDALKHHFNEQLDKLAEAGVIEPQASELPREVAGADQVGLPGADQAMQAEKRSSLEFRHPVVDKLSADEARDFLLALQQELVEQSWDGYIPADQVPHSAEEIVRWLVEVVKEGAEEPLGLIRGALERMDAESRRAPKEKLWEAACAVYCLAASRVLRAAAIRDQVGRVLAVPEGCDPVSAGLIVLALEGGKTILRISQHTGTADHVHDIGGALENGDWSTAALRRAIFSAIAGRNHRRTPWNEASSSDMERDEWEALRVVINDFRRRKQVLAIVVRNAIKDHELEEFASGLAWIIHERS